MNKPSKPPTAPTAKPRERTDTNPPCAPCFGRDRQNANGHVPRGPVIPEAGRASVATTTPTVPPIATTASVDLLKLIGHHESCARLQRGRAISSCDCRRGPMDDPSIAIGLVMHYARISLAQRVAIPSVIIELLIRHVDRGDLACRMVVEWLDTSGLLPLKPSPRSKRRPG